MISAVIPVFNGEKFVQETIDSLQATPEVTEIIVVDDGSTDASTSVVEHNFPNVQLIRQRNKRVSAARNKGWQLAQNSTILFLDQDDRVIPTGLAELSDAMSADTSVDFVYGDYVQIDEDGGSPVRIQQPNVTEDPIAGLVKKNCSSTVCCLFRKELLEQVGGFDEDMIGCEDWDLYLRLALNKAKFRYIPVPVYEFRYYPTSTSKDFYLMWRCFQQFEKKHREITRRFGSSLETNRRDKFLNDNLRHLYGSDESASLLKRRLNRTRFFLQALYKDSDLAMSLIRRALIRP